MKELQSPPKSGRLFLLFLGEMSLSRGKMLNNGFSGFTDTSFSPPSHAVFCETGQVELSFTTARSAWLGGMGADRAILIKLQGLVIFLAFFVRSRLARRRARRFNNEVQTGMLEW